MPDAMSAINVHTLVVPTSMPTIIWSAEIVVPPSLSVIRSFEESNVDQLGHRIRAFQMIADGAVGQDLGVHIATRPENHPIRARYY